MAFIKKIIIGILTLESRIILRKYKPFIVAVTGSVGKTSTKDAIYDVLKSPALCKMDGGICYVRKSEKSMNSDIGLPLTVIGVPNAWHSFVGWVGNMTMGLDLILERREYPDCLVLEVGADHPGDISKIASWLKPDIAVITKVSATPVHVEFFSSPEEVFEEKASLAESVKPGGTVVLFGDDDKVLSIAERAKVKEKNVRMISFGVDKAASVRGMDVSTLYDDSSGARLPAGISFTLDMGGETAPVSVRGAIGKVYAYPLLAAAAVGKAKGMNANDIAGLLSSYEAPRGRMNIIPGINGSILIDDTYNSSPDAALSALETLKGLECSGAKMAVLGDMMELGKYSAEEHKKIGREAVGIVNRLVTVGPRSLATAEEAIKAGMNKESVISFATADEAAGSLSGSIKSGDIVLIKGSQSVRMERVVKALMRDIEKSAELLVRQEKEWLDKA